VSSSTTTSAAGLVHPPYRPTTSTTRRRHEQPQEGRDGTRAHRQRGDRHRPSGNIRALRCSRSPRPNRKQHAAAGKKLLLFFRWLPPSHVATTRNTSAYHPLPHLPTFLSSSLFVQARAKQATTTTSIPSTQNQSNANTATLLAVLCCTGLAVDKFHNSFLPKP
jgi:hypothetical protein